MHLVICRIFCEELAKCKGNPSEVGRVFKKRVCWFLTLLKSLQSGKMSVLSVYRKRITMKKCFPVFLKSVVGDKPLC